MSKLLIFAAVAMLSSASAFAATDSQIVANYLASQGLTKSYAEDRGVLAYLIAYYNGYNGYQLSLSAMNYVDAACDKAFPDRPRAISVGCIVNGIEAAKADHQ